MHLPNSQVLHAASIPALVSSFIHLLILELGLDKLSYKSRKYGLSHSVHSPFVTVLHLAIVSGSAYVCLTHRPSNLSYPRAHSVQ
jgi:hypothetical protein